MPMDAEGLKRREIKACLSLSLSRCHFLSFSIFLSSLSLSLSLSLYLSLLILSPVCNLSFSSEEGTGGELRS